MASTARAWQHPRWQYDEERSEAARRSAARAAARAAGREGTRGAATAAGRVAKARPHEGRAVPREAAEVAPLVVIVPGGLRRPRFLRLATLILLTGVALVAPVSLNMASVGAEYQYSTLEAREDQLLTERASLQARRAALRSNQRVVAAADKLGLVSELKFEYLDLGSDGSAAADEVGPATGR